MTILSELATLREKLMNESSTKRCIFEQLIIVEKMIKMVTKSLKNDFCCANCPVWERDKGSEPGWGMCCYDNTLPETFEQHWCYKGLRLLDEGEKD